MGRMIDADKVIKDMQYYHDDCAKTSEYTRLGFETAIEVVKDAPTIEAIPKADYEARLKADMVVMLEDLKKEMNPIKECEYQIYGKEHWNFVGKCKDIIQQKIDALKEQTDGTI